MDVLTHYYQPKSIVHSWCCTSFEFNKGVMIYINMNLSKLQEIVKDREAWHTAVHGVARVEHDLAAEQQQQLLALA